MFDLKHVIDTHLHAGPELFMRSGDAFDFARAARERGMGGLVFKAHHESTATRAYFTRKAVPGIEVYGSITMNQYTGGINPYAVGAALEQGAKIVWGPTLNARHHVINCGAGTYGVPNLTMSNPELADKEGIYVLDEQGELIPEFHQVIRWAKEYDATIATAHLSDPESRKIVEACVAQDVRVVLTHVFFLDQPKDFILEMVALGALVEIGAAAAGTLERWLFRNHGQGMTLDMARDLILEIGADKVIISSDGGQDYATPPADMFQAFLTQLVSVGVPEKDVRFSVTEMPRRILGIA
jgi:hypothetical protein